MLCQYKRNKTFIYVVIYSIHIVNVVKVLYDTNMHDCYIKCLIQTLYPDSI